MTGPPRSRKWKEDERSRKWGWRCGGAEWVEKKSPYPVMPPPPLFCSFYSFFVLLFSFPPLNWVRNRHLAGLLISPSTGGRCNIVEREMEIFFTCRPTIRGRGIKKKGPKGRNNERQRGIFKNRIEKHKEWSKQEKETDKIEKERFSPPRCPLEHLSLPSI